MQLPKCVYHSAIINEIMVFFQMWFDQRKNFHQKEKVGFFLSLYASMQTIERNNSSYLKHKLIKTSKILIRDLEDEVRQLYVGNAHKS